MTHKVELGEHWRNGHPELNHIIMDVLLELVSEGINHETLITCEACGATWHGHGAEPCDWCVQRRLSRKEWILRPPAPRSYGHAPPDDLDKLGYDPELERRQDLEHWRKDLQLAADAGLITEDEGNQAWRSATKNQTESKSSTGTNSTPTTTKTTTRSFPASPSAAAGPPSRPQRKPGNRQYS